MTGKTPRPSPPARERRPDGYTPYRDRPTPPHLGNKDFQDGRAHPEADVQHYGDSPKKGGSQKPPMPAVKTQP